MDSAGRETIIIPLQTLQRTHGEKHDKDLRTLLFTYCKEHLPGSICADKKKHDLRKLILILQFVLSKMSELKIGINFSTGEPAEACHYIVFYTIVNHYAESIITHSSKRAFLDPQEKAQTFLHLIQAVFDAQIKKGIWTLVKNQ